MAEQNSLALVRNNVSRKTRSSWQHEDVAQEIMQELRVVVRTTQAHSRSIEKQSGVSGVQLWAMWELFDLPGQKVSDLSRTLSIHQSTASNMLDKLEKKQLIRRDRSGPDQRVVQLYLTKKGTELLSTAPRPAQGAVMDSLKCLTDDEMQQLKTGLSALIRHMAVTNDDGAMNPI